MKQLLSFILFVFILISCSSKTDKELFDQAKANIEAKEYADALSNFQLLLKDYPNSKLSAETVYEIGKLYHGKVIPNISGEESLLKAIEYYRRLYKQAPEFKGSENALFMIGFLQANELNQLDSARNSYNYFLEKYPNSDLAFSAKAELETLGIDPEEILKRATEAK